MAVARVPRRTIAATIANRSLGTIDRRKLAAEIAAYLLWAHRAGELNSLVRDIMQFRADRGIVEVVAVSAFSLTEQTEADIRAELTRLYPEVREIIISHRQDDSVVAGVKLEFANSSLDLSVRNKLNRLKQLTARV